MTGSTRRAFTLMELLTVLAILAILAAILAPAISRIREKGVDACMSNMQTIGQAILMYTADNNDTLPIFYQNDFGACLPTDPTRCNFRVMWQFSIAPYLTDWSVMQCPSDSALSGDAARDAFHVSYGYNYGYLSELCIPQKVGCPPHDPNTNDAQFFRAHPLSYVTRPSSTVMAVDAGGHVFRDVSIFGSMVNPPDALPSSEYFYGSATDVGWGKACKNIFNDTTLVTDTRWGDTDGFAARHTLESVDGANVLMVDGSVSYQTTQDLASGTNWTPDALCQNVMITSLPDNKWDPR